MWEAEQALPSQGKITKKKAAAHGTAPRVRVATSHGFSGIPCVFTDPFELSVLPVRGLDRDLAVSQVHPCLRR